MDSRLFKILLCLVIIVCAVVMLLGYHTNLFRNIIIGVFVFAFLYASWEAITEDNNDNYFPNH